MRQVGTGRRYGNGVDPAVHRARRAGVRAGSDGFFHAWLYSPTRPAISADNGFPDKFPGPKDKQLRAKSFDIIRQTHNRLADAEGWTAIARRDPTTEQRSRARALSGSVALTDRTRGGEGGSMKRTRRPRPPVRMPSGFTGFRFPPEVILLAVRWYLRYGLSYRDLEELLAERGIEVDHVTLYRWVQRFTPVVDRRGPAGRHVAGDRWFVDETYVKVAGVWRYVYRAVDQHGQVIDVYVSQRRDIASARSVLHRCPGCSR